MTWNFIYATSSSCEDQSCALAVTCRSKPIGAIGWNVTRAVMPGLGESVGDQSCLHSLCENPTFEGISCATACHNRFRLFVIENNQPGEDFATYVAEIIVGDQHLDNQIILQISQNIQECKTHVDCHSVKKLVIAETYIVTAALGSNHHGASCKETQDRLQCLVETPKVHMNPTEKKRLRLRAAENPLVPIIGTFPTLYWVEKSGCQ